ncbi:DUF3606 domain-containing protein [Pseudaminobacter sp. NGMCC 1.201702]|uniref:DUF3606 domain-containing protein n=1 Tax=Pseudaminobacter sp. NGMCC 1.201702 TaxID=3391825 RepID=UPI0039F0CE73
MTDDKSKRGGRDRDRVAGDQNYEVQYLAEQTGISQDQARELIRKHGNDRTKLMEEARKLA